MIALFILVVAITTYAIAYLFMDMVSYIGLMIAFNRPDSGITKVGGINTPPAYILAVCIPFIVWYCWTH